MARVLRLAGSVVGSAAVSLSILASNPAMFRALKNLGDSSAASQKTTESKQEKRRLPSNLQAVIDRSKADAQAEMDAVRAHVDSQLAQTTGTLNGLNRHSSSTSRRSKVSSGKINHNPYLD